MKSDALWVGDKLVKFDKEKLNLIISHYQLQIYIYIYKTEAFEASTIFHVSKILKNNNKIKPKPKQKKKSHKFVIFKSDLFLFY